jgi:hypothetical protein
MQFALERNLSKKELIKHIKALILSYKILSVIEILIALSFCLGLFYFTQYLRNWISISSCIIGVLFFTSMAFIFYKKAKKLAAWFKTMEKPNGKIL